MKEFLEKQQKKIILVCVLVVFIVGIVYVIINRNSISFLKMMGNSLADLEAQYTCEEGYTQSGTECIKEESIEATELASCEDGFTLNASTGKCEKQEETVVSIQYTCPEGYTIDNNRGNGSCEKITQYKATVMKKQCASGYTYNKETDKCEGTVQSPLYSRTQVYTCEGDYTLKDNQCVKVQTRAATKVNNCESGYNYNSSTNQCEKKDSMAAETLKNQCDAPGSYDGHPGSLTYGACVYSACPDGYAGKGEKCYKLSGSLSFNSSTTGNSISPRTSSTTALTPYTSTQAAFGTTTVSCSKGTLIYTATESVSEFHKKFPYLKTISSWSTAKATYWKIFICTNKSTQNLKAAKNGYKRFKGYYIKEPHTSYTCKEGYKYNSEKKKCERTRTAKPVVTYSCSTPYYDGYVYNAKANRCEKTTIKSAKLEQKKNSCAGEEKDGACIEKMTTNPQMVGDCSQYPNATYNSKTEKCEQIEKATFVAGYGCPEGYIRDGNRCVKTTEKDKAVTYSCPEGYTLDGNMCKREIIKTGTLKEG